MKNLISIILISLFVFALKAQNQDSLELLLESKYLDYDELDELYKEFEKLDSILTEHNKKYMGCPEHPAKKQLVQIEEKIIELEYLFNNYSPKTNDQ